MFYNILKQQETQRQAIERLKAEGYETLYVMNCYITDWTAMTSTLVWNIYANEDDANRWVRICKDYYSSLYADSYTENGDSYTYVDSASNHMEERFVLSVA